MKRLLQNYNRIIRIISFCGIILFVGACQSRPEGVLDEDDMTDVITDFHVLEGALEAKGMLYNSNNAGYYNFVLTKHEITKAQFDSSLVWYTKKPKKFKQIYKAVQENLAKLDEEVIAGKFHPNFLAELTNTKLDIWNKKTAYHFTPDSTRTMLDFEIKNPSLNFGDAYNLRFYQSISVRDTCQKPYIVLRINYADGTIDSAYHICHSDGLTRRFSVRMYAKRRIPINSISGSLLGSAKYKGVFDAKIDSISFLRTFNPMIQDSLRNLVKPFVPKQSALKNTKQ